MTNLCVCVTKLCVTKLCVCDKVVGDKEDAEEEAAMQGGANLKTRAPHNFVGNEDTSHIISKEKFRMVLTVVYAHGKRGGKQDACLYILYVVTMLVKLCFTIVFFGLMVLYKCDESFLCSSSLILTCLLVVLISVSDDFGLPRNPDRHKAMAEAKRQEESEAWETT